MTFKAYGAHAGDLPLEPMDITRRVSQPHDVQIELACCGTCHPDLQSEKSRRKGNRSCVSILSSVASSTTVNARQ